MKLDILNGTYEVNDHSLIFVTLRRFSALCDIHCSLIFASKRQLLGLVERDESRKEVKQVR